MTIDRMIDLLEVEKACVQLNADQRCDRDCANCNLVQEDDELIKMYIKVRELLCLIRAIAEDYVLPE